MTAHVPGNTAIVVRKAGPRSRNRSSGRLPLAAAAEVVVVRRGRAANRMRAVAAAAPATGAIRWSPA